MTIFFILRSLFFFFTFGMRHLSLCVANDHNVHVVVCVFDFSLAMYYFYPQQYVCVYVRREKKQTVK